ncbi:MAG: ABC transporter ATP-binding protein [Chloroflexota bacterium]|nr:ABC transporter ATP-binding protein [Chloroflexota bacterium]
MASALADGHAGQDLVVQDLVKSFKSHDRGAPPVNAVNHVSLRIQQGQFVTLLGPSGCGKTTTLNCIAGLEEPDGGRITVGETVLTDVARRVILPPERRDLGMVFQSYALWPHMTVYDNLAFGLKLRKVPGPEIRQRIAQTLDLVGLAGFEQRYPFQMSGGQQQRVALARAVVAQPRVLLLDEPLSNLDAKVREQARFWLRDFQKRLGITAVYVTPDQAAALAISDMVAVLASGNLLQYAPPREIYERPASRFVADFIGQTSMLRGVVVERTPAAIRVRLPSTGSVITAGLAQREFARGDAVLLAIRAERIALGATTGDNVLGARIKSFVYVGSAYQYLLETPEGEIRADAPEATDSSEIGVYLPPQAIVVLPDEPPRPSEPLAAAAEPEPVRE